MHAHTDIPQYVDLCAQMQSCADARAVLNKTIARKKRDKEAYDTECVEHNKLLVQELCADAQRMKLIMQTRRLSLQDSKRY